MEQQTREDSKRYSNRTLFFIMPSHRIVRYEPVCWLYGQIPRSETPAIRPVNPAISRATRRMRSPLLKIQVRRIRYGMSSKVSWNQYRGERKNDAPPCGYCFVNYSKVTGSLNRTMPNGRWGHGSIIPSDRHFACVLPSSRAAPDR